MNFRQLIRNSRVRARDLLANAFTSEQWAILLNDANDYAFSLARRSDPSYGNRIASFSGAIVAAGYNLPDDFASELDVRIFTGNAMFHADPVLQLTDPDDPQAGNPRWIIKGETLFVKEGAINAGSVERVELEYQRSTPKLFGAKVSAVGGGGNTFTIAEIDTIASDAFEGEVVLRDGAYVGGVIEATSGAAKWKRAKVTGQTGGILTVSPALTGILANDTIASVPLFPEDLHGFLAMQAVMDAYSSEDNSRGVNTVMPRYKEWEDRFRKGIESRVEGRAAPIQDVTQAGTYF